MQVDRKKKVLFETGLNVVLISENTLSKKIAFD